MSGQPIPDPVEPEQHESCRDVLDWTLQQVGQALDETDRVRAPLAQALVYGRAWMERTSGDDS